MSSSEGPSPNMTGLTAVTDQEYRHVTEFLYYEAQLLDRRKLNAWLELLTDDIVYRVVAPTVSALEDEDQTPEVLFMDEDRASLRTRVLQLSTPEYTVAENPPSITRRFVTNIFATKGGRTGQFVVTSNLLLYRSRGSREAPYLFSAERQDALQRAGDRLRIARRSVRLDEAVLGTRNMSVFF